MRRRASMWFSCPVTPATARQQAAGWHSHLAGWQCPLARWEFRPSLCASSRPSIQVAVSSRAMRVATVCIRSAMLQVLHRCGTFACRTPRLSYSRQPITSIVAATALDQRVRWAVRVNRCAYRREQSSPRHERSAATASTITAERGAIAPSLGLIVRAGNAVPHLHNATVYSRHRVSHWSSCLLCW
jgi:hypothetical protein